MPAAAWAQKEAWLTAVAAAGLGPNGIRVALALAELAGPDGTLAPGERMVALQGDVSRSTVWTYLRALQSGGLLVEIGTRAPGQPACYRLVVPEAGR